ncbi:MAG: SPOR domain-containing protein [Bacteroidales bacterium]|nr:SPOR domain-containing protein [Bacteroidales bacterium]
MMKFRCIALLIVLLFVGHFLFAQNYKYQQLERMSEPSDTLRRAAGKVEIIQDSRIDSIVKMHIAYNKSQEGIIGYRVQIFFDAGNNSLKKAEAEAAHYHTLFPTDTAYISFTEPYYKVRVGDFRTKLEAEGYKHKILKDYPNAFVIQDFIRFPELH